MYCGTSEVFRLQFSSLICSGVEPRLPSFLILKTKYRKCISFQKHLSDSVISWNVQFLKWFWLENKLTIYEYYFFYYLSNKRSALLIGYWVLSFWNYKVSLMDHMLKLTKQTVLRPSYLYIQSFQLVISQIKIV